MGRMSRTSDVTYDLSQQSRLSVRNFVNRIIQIIYYTFTYLGRFFVTFYRPILHDLLFTYVYILYVAY